MIAGTLEIQLLADLAKLTKGMDEAKRTVGNAMSGVESAVGLAKKALVGLGVALSAREVIQYGMHLVKLQENYVRLSEVAGTTAERMSSFDLSARLSGTSLDSVATSLAKLSRSLGEARLGDAAKQGMFKALGIDVNDGRDAAEIIQDVSRALLSMNDQNVAAVASNALLGRGFAELRPFMKEIVEQGTLNARVTEEQAKRAKEFEDNLVKLKFGLEQGKIALLNDFLPALNKVVEAMVRANKEGKTLAATIRAGIQQALTGDDLDKNTKEIAKLEAAKKVAQMRIDALNAQRAGPNNPALLAFQAQLEGINERLRIANQYRKELLAPTDFSAPVKTRRDAGAMSDDEDPFGLRKNNAEKNVRDLMEAQKQYDRRIALLKQAGVREMDATRHANQLLDLEYKASAVKNLRTWEENLRQKQANDEKFLQSEIDRLRRMQSIAANTPGKEKEAAEFAAGIQRIEAQKAASIAITEAQIRAERELTAQKQREDYNRFVEQQLELGQAQMELYGGQVAAEQRMYDQRLMALDMFLQQNESLQMQGEQTRTAMASQHRHRMAALAHEEWKDRSLFAEFTNRDLLAINDNLFGTLSQLMQSSNRKMFEVGKAAAIANTIISTYEGAQKAYTAMVGIPYVGPYLAVAAAAAAVAVGIQRVQAINNTKFGQNSMSSTGGGAMPTYSAQPGTNIPTAPVVPSGQQGSQFVVNVTVNGHILDQRGFTDEVLVPSLRDAIDNRDVTIIGNNSRQAAELNNP